ncbi:hypothetical protein, conserved [Leishmania lindenbergi]|uniref:IQ calmodulin-binding motif containing protein n=1 Tax=Leishmania lindenbergi TaxID=651832 RepID=A0AAW3AM15_9TRYP
MPIARCIPTVCEAVVSPASILGACAPPLSSSPLCVLLGTQRHAVAATQPCSPPLSTNHVWTTALLPSLDSCVFDTSNGRLCRWAITSAQTALMSTLFKTNAWERSPPSQQNGAAQPNNITTADVSKASSLALLSGCGRDQGTVQDGTSFTHSADALLAAGNPVAETDVLQAGGASTVQYGLVVTKSNKGGAVVVAHQPATFPGLYKDVDYPVYTVFAPPKPPGDMPPRVKRRARPGPVYKNDISTAGARQHRAQREVSRMWRGVLCRRRLQQARTLDEVLNNRVRRIQCWWRSLQARWRLRQLHAIRKEWAKERMARYITGRVENTKNIIYWQHCRYGYAAVLIQRMVRWYLREKQRRECEAQGVPESEWPPALEHPPTHKHSLYFPWRRPYGTAEACQPAPTAGELVATGENALHNRTLLQFREVRAPVPPPTQEEVEAINANMRERNAQQALALTTPETLSRAEWKTENIHRKDLDFNAAVVQRLYRSKQATVKVNTKKLTEKYLEKNVRIISRTFRMYVLMKRLRIRRATTESQARARVARRSDEKVEALKVAAVWQRDLMDASAMCIQRCWHWYRFEHQGVVPASYAVMQVVPTPPPYGLIDAHLKREREMRWASMNLMERHELEKQKRQLYLRYVPSRVIVCEHIGRFVAAPLTEL